MALSGDTITIDGGDTGTPDASAAPVPALTAVLVDPRARPEDLDEVAAGHPDLRLPATVIGAVRRIATGQGNDGLAGVLSAVEHHDGEQEVERAIRVLQWVPPSTDVAVARIALYSAARRHEAVLALTHGLSDVDDRTALSLVYRATALAIVGFRASARELYTAILRRRWHAGVREFARVQRRAVIGD
jgi:hypothetical protein